MAEHTCSELNEVRADHTLLPVLSLELGHMSRVAPYSLAVDYEIECREMIVAVVGMDHFEGYRYRAEEEEVGSCVD